ncbi:hypothetical protein ACIPSE_44510 [Streptomyces sp. NPDC090106]|uniref:hypothetical protein n=1 Tax=Streptomyces sp. NPDC090106 TaxID=3365946 RepID=UPI0038226CE7
MSDFFGTWILPSSSPKGKIDVESVIAEQDGEVTVTMNSSIMVGTVSDVVIDGDTLTGVLKMTKPLTITSQLTYELTSPTTLNATVKSRLMPAQRMVGTKQT